MSSAAVTTLTPTLCRPFRLPSPQRPTMSQLPALAVSFDGSQSFRLSDVPPVCATLTSPARVPPFLPCSSSLPRFHFATRPPLTVRLARRFHWPCN